MAQLLERAQGQAPPRVLIISPHGSYRIAPFLAAAARLGIDVTIASEGKHSVIDAYARGLHIDLADLAGARAILLNEARCRPFAGVVGTDDAATELAAIIARELGLRHNDPGATRIARRKDLARERLRQAGMPTPHFRRICLSRPLAPQVEDSWFPCVLKPATLSASRGVIRVDNREEFFRACARIQTILAHAEGIGERDFLLMETFIPGIEVALEGLLNNGELSVLAIFDKPDPLNGPFFEETYYITPSRHPDTWQDDLRSAVAAACAAYGLREGPIHAECRINSDGVWILEIAPRTIGGMCARLLQVGAGYSLEELVLAHALARPLSTQATDGGAGVLMIPIPKAGILRRIEGLTAAQRVPFIEDIDIQVREGYELIPLPEGASYLGFIFAHAPSPAQAEAALRTAHACLRIIVAPLWKAISA